MDDFSIIPFTLPKNFLIVGSTQCGKTQFIKRLIMEKDAMFKPVPERVIYCYSAWQPAYEEMENALGAKIDFRTEIPERKELESLWKEEGGETLLVLDDKMSSFKDNPLGSLIVDIFCVLSHHAHVSCVCTTQNIFHSKILREISLNSQYICLFRNNRSATQVKTLAQQIMPDQTKYLYDSYDKATSANYGYLLIELSADMNKLYRLRSCIFSGEDTVVYLPKV